MFPNALKTTLRALYRDKVYALINLIGLSLALACCMILGLYLRSELTYDQHHVQHERIFRVVNEITRNERVIRVARTSQVLGSMLAEDHGEIRDYVRFRSAGEQLVRHGDNAFYWRDAYVADDNVFEIFTHRIVAGDPATALVDPSSTAVSRTFAQRYFGDADPLGEVFTIDNGAQWKVALVFEDWPENTHLKYDILFSYNAPFFNADGEQQRRQALFDLNDFTYLLLPQSYDVRAFDAVSTAFFERHIADNPFGATWRAWLQPLADIHLHSDVQGDLPTANFYYLYGVTAVSIFILLVACINHMNLATARATRRAKEIGMRKILGASKRSLALQFLTESVVLAFAALAIGGVLVAIALQITPITDLLGKPLVLDIAAEPGLLLAMLGAALLVGIVSGLYPALYLTSILPGSALVGSARAGARTIGLRQFLVLFQFTITVAVIACTLLMAAQMRFVASQSLGFAKENRLMITLRGVDAIAQIPAIENELAKDSRVLGVTSSERMMGERFRTNLTQIESNLGAMEEGTVSHMAVADDFQTVMGMEIVTGRGFASDFGTDEAAAVIVNETLVAQRGWTEPLGKRLLLDERPRRVIGVVRDFNYRSLHEAVEPFVMYQFADDFENVPPQARALQTRLLVVNIAGDDVASTFDFVRDTVTRFDQAHPFEYRFVDESLDLLYRSEQRMMKLIGIFAAICIFIACLGVFGLAAFTTQQRAQEIGIRKVHGASTAQVIMLLSRNVLVLIVLGSIVASLAAYLAIDLWLAGFAYRAAINPAVFVAAAFLALGVAYATVALQSFKAARANPIRALRYE
jgi:putative ABC transport system permease protein